MTDSKVKLKNLRKKKFWNPITIGIALLIWPYVLIYLFIFGYLLVSAYQANLRAGVWLSIAYGLIFLFIKTEYDKRYR
jgi:hypothetical protein